jgi:hypothetical protein
MRSALPPRPSRNPCEILFDRLDWQLFKSEQSGARAPELRSIQC